MFRRVIAAIDGSELAASAARHGLTLARALGAPIAACFAVEPILTPMTAPGIDPASASLGDPMAVLAMMDQQALGEQIVRDFVALARSEGVEAEGLIRPGMLREVLAEVAGPRDMITIGRKGRFSTSGVGSQTRSLVTAAPCPVLVAHRPAQPLHRILAVYDGTAPSAHALRVAAELASATRWAMVVLAVHGRAPGDDDPAVGARRAIWPQGAPQSPAPVGAGALDAPSIDFITVQASDATQEAAGIQLLASKERQALVVMGAYAQNWLAELIWGGVTDQVMQRTRAPVLLVHSPE